MLYIPEKLIFILANLHSEKGKTYWKKLNGNTTVNKTSILSTPYKMLYNILP
jgi:hypothetical protein